MKTIKHKKIVGVGAVLADVIAAVDNEFLSSHGFLKGARLTGKRPILTGLMSKLQGRYQIAPGGSVCNTIIGVAGLGMPTAMAAKCGQDQLGALIRQSLEHSGVQTAVTVDSRPTGICLSLVTPEGERTMLVDLAASDALTEADVPEDFFTNAGIAHFEAYMAFNRELMLNLLDRAYDAGCVISLDLGSFSIIQEHAAFLQRIITDYVDVLIGNYSEGVTYTSADEDIAILKAMAHNTSLAALKLGAKGSLIYDRGEIIKIEPATDSQRPVVDTTGAGDLWNSGFLYGMAMGYDLATCGRLASLCGFEVCCTAGAQIKAENWPRINAYMSETGLA